MINEFPLSVCIYPREGRREGVAVEVSYLYGEAGRIEGVAVEGGYFGNIDLLGYIREGRALM